METSNLRSTLLQPLLTYHSSILKTQQATSMLSKVTSKYSSWAIKPFIHQDWKRNDSVSEIWTTQFKKFVCGTQLKTQ